MYFCPPPVRSIHVNVEPNHFTRYRDSLYEQNTDRCTLVVRGGGTECTCLLQLTREELLIYTVLRHLLVSRNWILWKLKYFSGESRKWFVFSFLKTIYNTKTDWSIVYSQYFYLINLPCFIILTVRGWITR